jgi:peptide/nickel transport system permease protein
MTQRLATPSASHPLGTDQVGRDVLSRLLYGGRVSLLIATLAVTLSISVGTLLGAVSGYVGGIIDTVTMRFVDVVISFPRLVLLVTLVAFFERTWLLLVLVLGLTQWPPIARIVRGEVLSLRERDFVVAARGLGFSTRRIVLRHLLPNVVAPVVVAATLGVGETIVLEAGLSFLGLGAGVTSWGAMIADGRSAFLGAWWLSAFPGVAIVLTVLAFNLVGDGLRKATSPRRGPAGGRV